MPTQVSEHDLPPGVATGEFVPLSPREFLCAYATAVQVMAGHIPADPSFHAVTVDLESVGTFDVEDTPLGRALYTAAGRTFGGDPARHVSFYWRSMVVLPLTRQRKYRKYVDEEAGALHVALVDAVCAVRGNRTTPTEALCAALDAEFRRYVRLYPDVAPAG